ncbi:MAG: MBL fold metallo-hydrolase [Bacillota bacterium]
MERVAENVYVETGYAGCNPGFVVTSKGVVMIDTPWLPRDVAGWREEIAKKGEVRYIINTEYHVDHISGNYYFPGIVVSHAGIRRKFHAPVEELAAPDVKEDAVTCCKGMRDYILYNFRKEDPESLPLVENYEIRPPEIAFTERLDLYVGEEVIELLWLPGHTPYQVGVYLPRQKILFTGDNVTNGLQPSQAHCCPLAWVNSMRKILNMDVEIVVPGHGEIGDKKMVEKISDFLQRCITDVNKAIAEGMSKEATAASLSFDYEGFAPTHPGAKQQHGNVTHLYEMLSGEKKEGDDWYGQRI